MKIDKNSWHYRMWRKSFPYGEYVPGKTDLCRYCHRVFWQLMAYVLAYVLLAGAIFSIVGLIFYMLFIVGAAFWHHAGAASLIVMASAAVITAFVLYARWLHRPNREPDHEPKTLVGKFVEARKQRVCPLVEFSDSEKEEV